MPQDKLGGSLPTGQAVLGIEVASAWSGLLHGTAGTSVCDAKGKAQAIRREADSTKASPRGGRVRSSDEAVVMTAEQRDPVIRSRASVNCESRRSG